MAGEHFDRAVWARSGGTCAGLAAVLMLLVALVAPVSARAAGVEYLSVPSAAMGREIPVAFQAGGPHAVYLLDAFNAGPEVSNWVSEGNAMSVLAHRGVSLVAPAGGGFSMYTDWQGDGSRQWETFLSTELPDWLAANKGLAAGGHGVVGAAQGGTAALTLATFHPGRFRYAGSLSGYLNPSATAVNGALRAGMMQFGGVDTDLMWGIPQAGGWKAHDPYLYVPELVNNRTRLWVSAPATPECSDPAAMVGYCGLAVGTNRDFAAQYRAMGGANGTFTFPASGGHDWGTWVAQLAALAQDLVSTVA